MKRNLLLKTMLLLCALIVGSSSVWADQEGSGIWTTESSAFSYAGSSSGAQLGSSNYPFNGTITLSESSIPSNAIIKQIVLTASSSARLEFHILLQSQLMVRIMSNVPIYGTSYDYIYNATKQGNGVIFNLSINSKKNIIITKIAVKYEDSDPTINASSPLDYDGDIVSGEIPYTVSNPIAGKILEATSDEAWISNISVGAEKVTFDMEENTGATRSGTVTLSYEGATSKDITINQAAAVVKHTVTINACENGSLAVLRGEDNVASGSGIPEGTKLTLCAIPDIGYRFRNWQYNALAVVGIRAIQTIKRISNACK